MMKMNMARLAEGGALVASSIALILMSVSGAYMFYVTPKALPYLYFAALALLILGIRALGGLFQTAHVTRYSHLSILLIPLALILWSAHDAGIIERLAYRQSAGHASSNIGYSYTMRSPSFEGQALHGLDPENRTLMIPQSETYHWLTEFYMYPEDFSGYTVTVMGQVLDDAEAFGEGNFAVIREIMVCCAADIYPIGFICENGGAAIPSEGGWVSVTGTLSLRQFEEYSDLWITAEQISSSGPPLEPYLYPF